MTELARVNRHGTALVIGDRGILIEGPSGSGKTVLALTLIRTYAASAFARLVADDQVFLLGCSGRLLAIAPDTISGLAEARGAGPHALEWERAAVIDLVVTLVEPQHVPRLADIEPLDVGGVAVPQLKLARRDAQAAAYAIAARLCLAPFVRQQGKPAAECGKMARP